MARKFLTILFICVLPLVKVAADDESPIVCSDHWHDETECENNVHCKFVTHYDQQDNTFCVPKCAEIDEEEECKKYAGCTHNGAECIRCERGSYCPGNSETYACATVDQDYSESQAGADSSDLCYKSCTGDGDMTCGIAKPGGHFALAGNIICLYTMDDNLVSVMLPSQEYHSEGVDGCYINNRDCNKFTAVEYDNDASQLDSSSITGEAQWSDNKYDISSCRYIANNIVIENCKANISVKPYNGQHFVDSAEGKLKFRTDGNGNSDEQEYYCTQCKNELYYPKQPNSSSGTCVNPPSGYKVCSCDAIPVGYYKTGAEWTYASQVGQPSSYYTACPAGKTTLNNIGGMSIGDCTYTRDTKFCDANGCFKITDADSWNWSD